MTDKQNQALKLMAEHNTGCVYVGEPRLGRYVWPEDIRANEQVAEEVIYHYWRHRSADFTS